MRVLSLLTISWVVLNCGGHPTDQTTPQERPVVSNPFLSESLFVDSQSQAAMATAKETSEEDAALLRMISEQPQADWLGEWSGLVGPVVDRYLDAAAEQGGKLRVMIAYNIPNRDCGQYSKGGVSSNDAYTKWITDIASAIGNRKTVIILEPDALGQLDMCLSDDDQATRLQLMKFAVETLRRSPNTAVYIDAGNANWVKPDEMAERLTGAGIALANGFALNTSNYVATDKTIAYGMELSKRLGGNVPFVIDTSRNGQGEAPKQAWCNPPGRGLGKTPTTETGNPLVHAFLWLKRPGESDGTCNEGPPAGSWFNKQAIALARNANQ